MFDYYDCHKPLPNWNPILAYHLNDVVQHLGHVYVCTKFHMYDKDPVENTVYWMYIGVMTSMTRPWSLGIVYNEGDVVSQNHRRYTAIVRNAGPMPGISNMDIWKPEGPEWVLDQDYEQGDQVFFGPCQYVCERNHKSCESIIPPSGTRHWTRLDNVLDDRCLR
jgi:hypothetical protein